MDFTKRIAAAWGTLTGRTKWVDVPSIIGGTDIFRNFLGDGAWGSATHMNTYKKSLYVFACVYKIAQKTASIDWELFRIKNLEGDKEQVYVSPVLDLLYKPNPFQTKGEFFQRFMINKKLTGSAFILKVRNNSGKVVELWNLRPDYMRIILDEKEIIKGYEFTGNGKTTLFEPRDIIHDSYPDPLNEFGGMSPLQPSQVRVDTEQFATKYQANFYKNNARPDFLLLAQKKVSPDQKEEIRESWNKRHRAGKDQKNVGQMGILEGGMTLQTVSLTQQAMEHIESLKMTRDDILVAFQVPKPIIAITEDVNYANANTAMEVFLSETIVPEITQLTEKINEHLVYDDFDATLYIDFVNPVRDNVKETAEVHEIQLRSGTKLINEAREELGLPPVQGGWSLYIPFSSQPVGGLPAPTEGKTIGRDDGNHYIKGLSDTRKSVFRGRTKAWKRLKLERKIERMLMREVKNTLRKELSDEVTPEVKVTKLVAMEQRDAYVGMVLKQMDKRGDALKEAFDDFSAKQKARVFRYLKLDKSVKADGGKIERALEKWAVNEVDLTTEFSLPYIENFVREAGEEAMALVAPAETFDETAKRVQKYIKDRAKRMAKETTVTTLDKLTATLGAGIAADEGTGALVARIDSVFADFPLYRSEMIARTEATSANNKGFMEAYEQSGVANAKEWIATGDDRTRDSHIMTDGEVVKLDDEFSNGLAFPGDPSGGAEETVNCRCVLAPAFRE